MQLKSTPALRKRDQEKDKVKRDYLAHANLKDNSGCNYNLGLVFALFATISLGLISLKVTRDAQYVIFKN